MLIDTLKKDSLARSFLLVSIATIVAGIIFILRMKATGQYWGFRFLIWNLFLAWIPWMLSTVLTIRKLPSWLILPGLGIWILFFPNAPYILTDLMHLRWGGANAFFWLDWIMLLSFAWTGMLLGFHSMKRIESRIFSTWGRWARIFLVPGLWFLTAYGIFLGRFLRLNSWDVFVEPMELFHVIVDPWLEMDILSRPIGFTATFGFFLTGAYYVFMGIEKANLPEENRGS